MNDKALEKLRGRSTVNYDNRHYPRMYPTNNFLTLHIEIYKLIDEYIGIYEDKSKVGTPSSKRFIEERMEQIERALTNYWIVPDHKMEKP